MKPKRLENRKLLDTYHARACVACGATPSDPAHIKSRGSGGDDIEWNLIALCRRHHSESHAIGWRSFSCIHLRVRLELERLGWTFDERGRITRS